jgi:hypothetical protein
MIKKPFNFGVGIFCLICLLISTIKNGGELNIFLVALTTANIAIGLWG